MSELYLEKISQMWWSSVGRICSKLSWFVSELLGHNVWDNSPYLFSNKETYRSPSFIKISTILVDRSCVVVVSRDLNAQLQRKILKKTQQRNIHQRNTLQTRGEILNLLDVY